jgi:hypothetical protein
MSESERRWMSLYVKFGRRCPSEIISDMIGKTKCRKLVLLQASGKDSNANCSL